MFVGRNFPPFENQGARLLGFDLANLLASGETITAITSRLRTVKGTDIFPENHLPVVPRFAGSAASQLVAFDDPTEALVGNVYALSFAATTSAGQILAPWAAFHVAPGVGITAYPGGSPPASAQSITLTAAPLFYTLPTLTGGYVGQDLPAANQGEQINYGFDFSPALSPGETIASAQLFLSLIDGIDAAVTASPTAYAVSGPSISGGVVTQMLAWPGGAGLVGNIYGFQLTAVTSFNQSLPAWARIRIGRVG